MGVATWALPASSCHALNVLLHLAAQGFNVWHGLYILLVAYYFFKEVTGPGCRRWQRVGRLGGWAVGRLAAISQRRGLRTDYHGTSLLLFLAAHAGYWRLAAHVGHWLEILSSQHLELHQDLCNRCSAQKGTTPADPASVETKDGWLNSRYHCGVCCFALRFAKSGNLKIY